MGFGLSWNPDERVIVGDGRIERVEIVAKIIQCIERPLPYANFFRIFGSRRKKLDCFFSNPLLNNNTLYHFLRVIRVSKIEINKYNKIDR